MHHVPVIEISSQFIPGICSVTITVVQDSAKTNVPPIPQKFKRKIATNARSFFMIVIKRI